MVVERPKIVIIGAGMAGLTAAQKLYTESGAKESFFDLCVVEGGQRIGGRINTTEFMGDRIEMGATWIHGICGSPIYEIAQKIKSLNSEKPWECMDDLHEEKLMVAETRAEGGFIVNPQIVEPISSLFNKLMSFSQGKGENGGFDGTHFGSIGSFLKVGLQQYWDSRIENGEKEEEVKICGNWSRKMLEEGIFGIFENTQRTYTGAGDLFDLDYASESEYRMFSGDEITIPKGYISIIEELASVLPPGVIQLGKKVVKIEWLGTGKHHDQISGSNTRSNNKPVKLHFSDGSIMQADHVIVTVSLGVLKAGVNEEIGNGLFSPPLPCLKKDAILRLGYGVVNKLFLELNTPKDEEGGKTCKIPFMKMVFHRPDSEFRHRKIPWWMRKTSSLYPMHNNSSVFLGWFAGKEALELESLDDETITEGVSTTVSSFIANSDSKGSKFEFRKVLKSKWGSDPLFLGSYSYVSVGSSGDDFDIMAKPLPEIEDCVSIKGYFPLQILFAGEATHRTHYSTTHGAYFSGLREANRLLQHYHLLKNFTNII